MDPSFPTRRSSVLSPAASRPSRVSPGSIRTAVTASSTSPPIPPSTPKEKTHACICPEDSRSPFHLPPRRCPRPGAVPHQQRLGVGHRHRSEEHTSELQSLMRISYAVFCLKK